MSSNSLSFAGGSICTGAVAEIVTPAVTPSDPLIVAVLKLIPPILVALGGLVILLQQQGIIGRRLAPTTGLDYDLQTRKPPLTVSPLLAFGILTLLSVGFGCSADPARRVLLVRQSYNTVMTAAADARAQGLISDANALRIEQMRRVAASGLAALDAQTAATNETDTNLVTSIERTLADLAAVLKEVAPNGNRSTTRPGVGVYLDRPTVDPAGRIRPALWPSPDEGRSGGRPLCLTFG